MTEPSPTDRGVTTVEHTGEAPSRPACQQKGLSSPVFVSAQSGRAGGCHPCRAVAHVPSPVEWAAGLAGVPGKEGDDRDDEQAVWGAAGGGIVWKGGGALCDGGVHGTDEAPTDAGHGPGRASSSSA